jgi:hypothetical protein
MLLYDNTTKEIQQSTSATSGSSKTFVIPHPIDDDKYLIHGCLEGPEVGVYYRGRGEVGEDGKCEVKLPDYVSKFSCNLDAHVTVRKGNMCLRVSDVYDGKFMVSSYVPYNVCDGRSSVPCEFNWVVYGTRDHLETEVDKQSFMLRGDGPYKWVEKL